MADYSELTQSFVNVSLVLSCILRGVQGIFHVTCTLQVNQKETDVEQCGQSNHIDVRNVGVDAAAFAWKNRTPSIPMGCSPSSIFWVERTHCFYWK